MRFEYLIVFGLMKKLVKTMASPCSSYESSFGTRPSVGNYTKVWLCQLISGKISKVLVPIKIKGVLSVYHSFKLILEIR